MPKHDLTHDFLLSILDYNPETGVFTWRDRAPDLFEDGKKFTKETICKRWNKLYAGTTAGTLNGKGARQINISGNFYFEHRLAWFWVHGSWPKNQIDHIDGTPQNNRLNNLREATVSQNNCNRKPNIRKGVSSKGVHLYKGGPKYGAQIKVNRVHHWLGLFDSEEEAAKAYQLAAQKLHGEFARFE